MDKSEVKTITEGLAVTIFNESLSAMKPAVVMDEKQVYQTGKGRR